ASASDSCARRARRFMAERSTGDFASSQCRSTAAGRIAGSAERLLEECLFELQHVQSEEQHALDHIFRLVADLPEAVRNDSDLDVAEWAERAGRAGRAAVSCAGRCSGRGKRPFRIAEPAE